MFLTPYRFVICVSLQAIRDQLSECKTDLIEKKAEVVKLRGRLNDFYMEKHNSLLQPLNHDTE